MPEAEDVQIKVKIQFPFILNQNIDAKPATPKCFGVSRQNRSKGEDSSDLILDVDTLQLSNQLGETNT